jgi:hypothetical protein
MATGILASYTSLPLSLLSPLPSSFSLHPPPSTSQKRLQQNLDHHSAFSTISHGLDFSFAPVFISQLNPIALDHTHAVEHPVVPAKRNNSASMR